MIYTHTLFPWLESEYLWQRFRRAANEQEDVDAKASIDQQVTE
jgi:hypothetical protein